MTLANLGIVAVGLFLVGSRFLLFGLSGLTLAPGGAVALGL
jgi:hypothetical protein